MAQSRRRVWTGVWVVLACFVGWFGSQEATAKPPKKTQILPMGREKQAQKWQKQRRCLWGKHKGKDSKQCRRYARKAKPTEVFLLVIAASKKMLMCRGSRLLHAWAIGHGRRGFGKQREGDKKTPLGTYRITWMAARHEPRRTAKAEQKQQRFRIVDGRAYCMHNRVTNVSEFRRDKGPRDERLWLRPYGGRYATVMALNYPNALDQKSGRTGSCIEIHASYHLNGSAGCITLYPHHAVALYNCLSPQTRVEIIAR